jgi:16S rRNA (uracil1498-N3)-methyltransferase
MPRFFVAADAIAAGRCRITGADATHLSRSLRARAGEEVVVVDGAGVEHGVRLEEVGAEACEGAIVWSRPSAAEPRLRVIVVQALPQQGMEEALDAMVQAGVADVRPVWTARTVVRLDAARAARRLERWRAVAREAAGLAHRGAIPDVAEPADLPTAIARLGRAARLLVAAPGAAQPLAGLDVDPEAEVAVVIGPEGGLGDAELDLLAAAGATPVHLGPRVLRARLAGAVATTLLLAAAGDLEWRPARGR